MSPSMADSFLREENGGEGKSEGEEGSRGKVTVYQNKQSLWMKRKEGRDVRKSYL